MDMEKEKRRPGREWDAAWNSLGRCAPRFVLVLALSSGIGSFLAILVTEEVEPGGIIGGREFGGFGKLLNGRGGWHFSK